MSNRITVSANRMKQDRENISTNMDRIVSEIGELRDAMLALSACWEGPAWETFQNELHTTLNEMYDICGFLAKYTEQTGEAAKDYQNCENTNRDMMGRVWI